VSSGKTLRGSQKNAANTKERILQAARRLFAERDITTVGIRDIAVAAGVSHGLVQRYCGTREQMIAEIVRQEIESFSAVMPPAPAGTPQDVLEILRGLLQESMRQLADFAPIIARAELAGIEPGTMIEQGRPTPAMRLAVAIRNLQAQSRGDHPPLDPVLLSAYITASLFAFGAMAPWLMASVGLDPEDFEARRDEIADISVRLIALASGTEGKQARPGRLGAGNKGGLSRNAVRDLRTKKAR